MAVFAMLSIYSWQYDHLSLSTVCMAIAINIKMSALLLVPGYLLTIAFQRGLIQSLVSLAAIIFLQAAIAFEFLMSNPSAYFKMAYNFERVFLKVEQVNF